MKDGTVCLRCGCEKSIVYDSRNHPEKNSMYGDFKTRRRKCKECGFKWVTVEIHWHDAQKLIENFGDSANLNAI